ncbi:MAG TPA: BRCT domain-containing protein, partial [Gammaproteobacteria bacterium]|nr:BRCT domain-containing protein [Gammaproteobacteria bacterium]
GLATSNSLADNFSTLDDRINADTDQLTNIQDIGPIVAESIMIFLDNEKNLVNIELLIKAGINIEYQKKKDSQILENKTFVLTGSLASMTRSDAQRMIEDNGGKVTSSVSQNTSYLVTGKNPGSKIKKASNIGVNIISEDELVNLINDG